MLPGPMVQVGSKLEGLLRKVSFGVTERFFLHVRYILYLKLVVRRHIQLLLSSVSGPVQKKRKEYQCKRCGENGHNASTCKNLVDSIPSKFVKSGSYVIGSDPTTCLGLDRKIYVENGQKIEYRDNELQKAVKKILACTLVFGEDEFFATCEDILKLVQQTNIDTATDVLCKAIVCPKCIFHISSIPGSFERYLRGLLPVNCNMY